MGASWITSAMNTTARSRVLGGIHIRLSMVLFIRPQGPRAPQLGGPPDASARCVLGQELLHELFRRRLVLGLFPVLDERSVGRERRDLTRRGLGVVHVIAQQHQQGRLAAGDEFPRYVEEKIAAVHGPLE